jgi:hypothetical protein
MGAESDVLTWLQDSLFMNIKGVGPNVFAYNIEHLTTDIMPAITIRLISASETEASTLKNNHKRLDFAVGIHTINDTAFWHVKMLCDIRERVAQVLESMSLPSSVVDFTEESAGSFEARTELERPVLSQEINYSFLVRETDY